MGDRAAANPNAMISNSVLTGGTYNMQTTTINQGTPRDPLKILQDASSPSAFHNSGDRYDPPKCHENTRVAVLKKIMDWIIGCDTETRDKWIMWLYGGAGAGKSAIGQTIAERCYAEGRLLASFFFGRSDGTRNQAKFLIPTIACQIYANIPGVRQDIALIINNDPLIFNKSLLIQFISLVVEPLRRLGDTVSHHLIIIDGLDECVDRAAQVTILCALFDVIQNHSCRIRFLVASRPEHDIVNTFSLRNVDAILARLVLDDTYKPLKDIKLFLNAKFKEIAERHPFRNLIPKEWPGNFVLREITRKSSGQFVYASVVVKYIESIRHRPDQRLEIIRNLRPSKEDFDMPFAELDALYTHILSSIEDLSLAVEILSFIIHDAPVDGFASGHVTHSPMENIEEILNLEPGTLHILLCDLDALVVVETSFTNSDSIRVLHTSLLDFLSDPSRSKNLHVIQGNLLITKHVTSCFRFLSKNTDSNSTRTVIRFLANCCAQVSFTEDMANAFGGFSLLKLFQHDALNWLIKYNFLLRLNPILLELIRRSDQHRFLSWYLTMLDESYITLLDKYPPESLALQTSILMHENTFPSLAIQGDFRLPPFRVEDDSLWIMPQPYYQVIYSGLLPAEQVSKDHRAALREFFLNPTRSRHHSFHSFTGKTYAKSLLGCFNYLDTQLFRYHYCLCCSTDGICLIPFTMKETTKDLNDVFHNEETADALGAEWEGHQITKENWNKYFSYNPDDSDIMDNNKEFQAWYENWHQVVFSMDNQNLRKSPLYYRMRDLPWGRDPDSLRRLWLGRYGLMLGYMIYFFPRAGKSQKLVELCKTTILRRDLTLFPADTVRAQRAMAAYVKKVEALEDEDSEVHIMKRLLSSLKDTKTSLPSGSLMTLD